MLNHRKQISSNRRRLDINQCESVPSTNKIYIYIDPYISIYIHVSICLALSLISHSWLLALYICLSSEMSFKNMRLKRRLQNGGHSPPDGWNLACVMKKQPNIKLYLSCTCPYRWPNTISCYVIYRQRVDQEFFHFNSIQFKFTSVYCHTNNVHTRHTKKGIVSRHSIST